MKTRIIAVMLLTVTLVGTLTACQKDPDRDPLLDESKQTLVDMINSDAEQMTELIERVNELEELQRQVTEEKGPTSAIVEMDSGLNAGKKTFTTVNDIFQLPIDFMYPGSTQAPNTASINISEAVSITPTPNWYVRLTGTTLEVSHSSNIAGTISVGYLDREARKTLAADLDPAMDEMLTAMNVYSKLPSKLFISGTQYGVDNISTIFVDEKETVLRCGILGYSDISIQYMFTYAGERDSSKDEVILSLIKTLKVFNNELSVE